MDFKGTEPETLTSQSQDYLEAIAQLQAEDHVARAKDIADRLGVTRGTVTSALRSLHEKGLINYQPYSHITLTTAGQKLAAEIMHRHSTLSRYLREVLQLTPEVAEENACRAEHALDREVIERLNKFLDFLDKCPRTGSVWKRAFTDFCGGEGNADDCRQCVGECMAELYTKD